MSNVTMVSSLNQDTFWAMTTAVATLIGVGVALWQLRKIVKTNNADFIHRFKLDFFTKDAQELIFLIEHDLLTFTILDTDSNEEEMSIFEAKKDKYALMERPKHKYTTTEVDRLVLGHLEDIGIYEKKGQIDIDTAYEEFSEYIERAWENPAIMKYIKWTTDGDYEDTYSNFKYIYDKCVVYGKAKRENKNLWWWEIRWWIKEKILRI